MPISDVMRIISNLTKSGETLTHRVVISGFWVFILRVLQKVIGLVKLVVLARVLTPEDFGLIGIALITIATLEMFSTTGFQQALIQKKENIDLYLNTSWTVSIVRGTLLFLILLIVAPYAAVFFSSTESKSVIQVIAVSILFQAFTNIGIIYFRKDLEFNRHFIYELVGTLVEFIVSVSTALILRNVWSIVFGVIAGNFATCLISYYLHPYRPRLSIDFGKAKELWKFGKWLSGTSILNFLITQGDDIFIGKILGATALGFYQMAYRISNVPATEVTHVISQVIFPAYSKLQSDISKLRRAFLQTVELSAIISLPLAASIYILAQDFVYLFLGDKWNASISAIKVLALWGAIRSISSSMGPLFNALGKPRIITITQFVKLLLIALMIYPLTIRFGIVGTCIAITIPPIIIDLPLLFYRTRRYLEGSFSIIFESLKAPIICTLFTVLGILLGRKISVEPKAIGFLLSAFLGAALYILSLFLLKQRGIGNLHDTFIIFRRALIKTDDTKNPS
ncbi:MAG: lipopolysaccharide biosynthesis protein [Candidatus Dadabacteria bacterium]|nr:lipopolysaccharide biosynthesis protein [Candidatus Dadabacteria bacterium]